MSQLSSDAAVAGFPKEPATKQPAAAWHGHPILWVVARRIGLGVLTLLLVSVLVFAATQVLPGNAANAVLLNTATPERVAQLEEQLHLNDPIPQQYWRWLSGVLQGDPGTSITNSTSVSEMVGPRLRNSAVLVLLAALIGAVLGVVLGVVAAARRDRLLDHVLSVAALAVSAVPEFVVGITLVIVFSTVVFSALPAVSVFPPDAQPWDDAQLLVLPVATLVIVIFPYIFRMTRGATIEALHSDYVEMAELKGIARGRVLFLHALLNAVPATVQVIGLNLLYLAGGIVVIEYVFNYPGIGQTLVAAVSTRDIPVIQFVVLLLAAFYVLVNIVADVLALLATPRRRLPRSG